MEQGHLRGLFSRASRLSAAERKGERRGLPLASFASSPFLPARIRPRHAGAHAQCRRCEAHFVPRIHAIQRTRSIFSARATSTRSFSLEKASLMGDLRGR